MPGFDGTGPAGGGAMTGRGLGSCVSDRLPLGYRSWRRLPIRGGRMGYQRVGFRRPGRGVLGNRGGRFRW